MPRNRSAVYIDKGVSIYLRPSSPFWQLRLSRHGIRVRESLNTSDVEAAKAIARRRADERLSETEGIIIPRDVSYDDLLTAYKKHAELRNRPSTRKLNYDNLERVATFMRKRIRGQRPLMFTDFSVQAIEAYAKARRDAGLEPDTINRELGSLSTFFSRGKKARLIRSNPAMEVDRIPVARNTVPVTLTPVQITRLLEAAAQPVDLHGRGRKGRGNTRPRLTPMHDFILFILNTGARLGDALFFEWKDIDFKEKLILFSNKVDHTIKDRKQRGIPANAVVLHMLRRRKLRSKGLRWVFPSATGEPMDRKNVLRELTNAAERAEIKEVNFLILRHTALTGGARSGLPPFILKEMAGHGTIRTTERYYIRKMVGADWVLPEITA